MYVHILEAEHDCTGDHFVIAVKPHLTIYLASFTLCCLWLSSPFLL